MAFGIDLPGSSDPGATLRQHFEFKMVTLDLTKGSSTTPTSDSSAASPTKTSPAGHRTNPADDIPLLQYQRMIVAHGIFLTVAFLLLLPGGALLARYLRTFTPTWFLGHTIAQFWLCKLPPSVSAETLGLTTTSGACDYCGYRLWDTSSLKVRRSAPRR
ncbi:hypothetical protein C0989_005929 [Termitomyces sp. Mn162]|nr:hypothetical protein C0989_005929 [Termitomyces sp. Mn162]